MLAFALIAAHGVFASSSIVTRLQSALIDILFTSWSSESKRTVAEKVLGTLRFTCASVGAGAVSARSHLNLAVHASKTGLAEALKVVNFVHTLSPVSAFRRSLEQAVVVVMLAVLAGEASAALAGVGVSVLVAYAGMLARIGPALVFL